MKKMISDLNQKINLVSIDLERKMEENKNLLQELKESKEMFKAGAGDLQKELAKKKEQIEKLEEAKRELENKLKMLENVN